MSDYTDHEGLLREVLGEEEGAGCREALLAETLRRVRRRRRVREARGPAGVVALAATLALAAWHPQTRRSPSPAGEAGYGVVSTQPLAAMEIVETGPLAATHIITTAEARPRLRDLRDDELLALAAPEPVVLIRLGPDAAELVFTEQSEGTD